jgi:hypothetical protein
MDRGKAAFPLSFLERSAWLIYIGVPGTKRAKNLHVEVEVFCAKLGYLGSEASDF